MVGRVAGCSVVRAHISSVSAVGGEGRAQLRRAKDPWLLRAAAAYQDAGYHDGVGGDGSTAVRWWVRWTRNRGESMVKMASPIDGVDAQRRVEESLILFAVWLVEVRGVTAATAKGYVSTVRAWHARRFGPMLAGFATVRLRAVLKGMTSLRPPAKRRERTGIPTQVLSAGIRSGLGESVDDVSAAAALSLAFCGLLRVSEYAADSGALRDYDRSKLPVLGDLSFGQDAHGEFAQVMMWPRKKGSACGGKRTPVIVRDGSLLAPVTALKRMVALRADDPNAPLFCMGGRPLTVHRVNALVKFVARVAGVDPRPFSSHSLRIGGATAALAAGMSPLTIRVMGRWDSDAYEVYCRLSRQTALRVGAVVASTPFDEVAGAFIDEDLM